MPSRCKHLLKGLTCSFAKMWRMWGSLASPSRPLADNARIFSETAPLMLPFPGPSGRPPTGPAVAALPAAEPLRLIPPSALPGCSSWISTRMPLFALWY